MGLLYDKLQEAVNHHRYTLAGLPETVTDVLRAARVSSTRPHEFPGYAGAQRVPVHTVFNIRGADGFRCAPQSLHRYSLGAPRSHA